MSDKILNCNTSSHSKTYFARIYISGPIDIIKHVCRQFCKEQSLCVNISETLFIYKGGEEFGACVELINYPKYPKRDREILGIAIELASCLKGSTYQDSVLIMTPDNTFWYSDREKGFTFDEVKEMINNKYKNEKT